MTYQLSMQTTGVTAGLLLIVSHAAALTQPALMMRLAASFPRSRAAGTLLIALAAFWSFLLVSRIDLGEFSPLRHIMLTGIVAGGILAWLYLEEFLAVRALGMILLLAAEPLLESALLRTEPDRILLTVLGVGWAIVGLFLVGMPYLLRDALTWVSSNTARWSAAAGGGLLYGIALTITAILRW
jgi:hypothetical protein